MKRADRPHWSVHYIGLPWRAHGRDRTGFDCWGLVREVLANEKGVALPSLAGVYADPAERAEIDAIMNGAMRSLWREIAPDDLRPFDILVFGGAHAHVGVAVDAERMLHVDRGRVSEIVRLDGPRWKKPLAVICRHCLLDGGVP